jgi:hypothetical protein
MGGVLLVGVIGDHADRIPVKTSVDQIVDYVNRSLHV